MSAQAFKPILQRDKLFLKELYESDNAKSKRILTFASDAELNTLCKYLHFLSNGDIKIKKINFDGIGQRKMLIIKKFFEPKKKIQEMNQMARKDKLKVLFKFVTIFNQILAPLFVE